MKSYVLLKNGRILEVWSDNVDDRDMECYPDNLGRPFDIESDYFLTIEYDAILKHSENIHELEEEAKKIKAA